MPTTSRAAATGRRDRRSGALLVAILATVVAPVTVASAGDGGFRAGDELAGVAAPRAVAVGDFDADGRPDIAAVSHAGHAVVRLGRAGGSFAAAPNVAVGKEPGSIVVADFNADGHDDLAVGNAADRDVSVRLGAGDGTFRAADDVALARVPLDVAVGDFNADGREDLAIATSDAAGSGVAVRLGAGDGTFAGRGEVAVRASTLAVGDLDADGDEDLVVGSGAQHARALLGSGDGSFVVGAVIALPGSASSRGALAVGDFDADGRPDVVAALSDRDAVSVRLGAGDGTFGGGTEVPVGDRPYAVAVGDLDADGREDLVNANAGGETSSVRLGNGDGSFEGAADVGVGRVPVDVVLADFDADGSDDLATANFQDASIGVRYGTGLGHLAGNLLANGGFEGPGAAAILTQSPAIPGWERSGAMTFVRYGIASHAYFPSRLASPRHTTGGSGLLWGGRSTATGGITQAVQAVDVSSSAASIDAGRATAGLSADLGGALHHNDRMDARAEFLDGAGATLGSLTIGPVTAADRKGQTRMLRRAARGPVPAGSRTIRVTLTSTDDDMGYSSAVADNVRLTLDAADPPAPAPQPQPQPQPRKAPSPAAFGPSTGVSLVLAARRVGARGRIRVRVRNRNAFGLTGTLTVRAIGATAPPRGPAGAGPRRLRLPAAGSRTATLALPASLRRQLRRRGGLPLRLTAVLVDPAGNRRTVRRQVRLLPGR